jgi:acylglycerol lipase
MGCTSSALKTQEEIDFAVKCIAPEHHRFSEEKISVTDVKTKKTSQRNVAVWLPLRDDSIKAVVFVSHGLGEHVLCYHNVASAFVSLGYAVYGIDHVSHGRSDGPRGVIPSGAIVNDFVQFVNEKRLLHPGVPVFIVAHSMGTLVALNALSSLTDIRAIVLSGPALFGGPAASSPFGISALYPLTKTSFAVGLTNVTATLDPAGPCAPVVADEITSNKVVLQEMTQDPRRNAAVVTNRTAKVLLKLIRKAKAAIPNIDIPIFCIHGEQDLIALKEGSEFVFANVKTPLIHKKLSILPGRKHEVFNEPSPHGEQAIAEVVQFIEDHFLFVNEPTTAVVETNSSSVVDLVASQDISVELQSISLA